MTNAVVYSAIYGDYEATAKPVPPDLRGRAVMFTDNQKIAEQAPETGWQVVFEDAVYHTFDADPANGDPAVVRPMLAHKWWKTHPDYAVSVAADRQLLAEKPDVTIWVDGNMRITMSGFDFVDRCLTALGDDDWSLMKHPWRGCIYDEHDYTAAVCYGRYSVEAMARQRDAYREMGHPREWGLFATGHMVRRHTESVHRIGEEWWEHNVRYSHQDQLSLPVLIALDAVDDQHSQPLRWNADLPWGMWDLLPHGT